MLSESHVKAHLEGRSLNLDATECRALRRSALSPQSFGILIASMISGRERLTSATWPMQRCAGIG